MAVLAVAVLEVAVLAVAVLAVAVLAVDVLDTLAAVVDPTVELGFDDVLLLHLIITSPVRSPVDTAMPFVARGLPRRQRMADRVQVLVVYNRRLDSLPHALPADPSDGVQARHLR